MQSLSNAFVPELGSKTSERPGLRQPQLVGTRESLDCVLEAQRIAFASALALRTQLERSAPAGVTRTTPALVQCQSRQYITGDPRVQRAVTASKNVEIPR